MKVMAIVCGLLAAQFVLAEASHASQLEAPSQEPLIAHGSLAQPCAWPTVVAVEGGSVCTGTLVHPQVVIYAAHCGGGPKTIRLSELSEAGGRTVEVERCVANPSYGGDDDQGRDWAYCLLAEPVDALPVAPPVYGCELEVLEVGTEVALVGFGETDTGEVGAKRWAATTLVALTPGNNTSLVGDPDTGSTPSVCAGDSGGPGFVQLADGSWRTFGIASTMVGECGGYGAHSLVPAAVPWIEFDSGVDITPCHTVDGAWAPGPACAGLFAGASDGTSPSSGVWDDWCAGTSASDEGSSCGEAWDTFDPSMAPSVSIVEPAPQTSFPSGSTIEVLVDAHRDPEGYAVAQIWLEVDGEQVAVDESEPYLFELEGYADGQHVILARVEDWAGNEVTSERSFWLGEPEGEGTETGDELGVDDGGDSGCQCVSSQRPSAPFAGVVLMIGFATVGRWRRRRRDRLE